MVGYKVFFVSFAPYESLHKQSDILIYTSQEKCETNTKGTIFNYCKSWTSSFKSNQISIKKIFKFLKQRFDVIGFFLCVISLQ